MKSLIYLTCNTLGIDDRRGKDMGIFVSFVKEKVIGPLQYIPDEFYPNKNKIQQVYVSDLFTNDSMTSNFEY